MSGLHFTPTFAVALPRFAPLSLSFLSLMLFPIFILFIRSVWHSEENSFVTLDHSGILETELVSILEETQFTILIDAYPAPKVTWMKDSEATPENYYTFTNTSHVEGNR